MSQARSVTVQFNTTPVTRTLALTKEGTGTGTVTSNPAGINCGATVKATSPTGAGDVRGDGPPDRSQLAPAQSATFVVTEEP